MYRSYTYIKLILHITNKIYSCIERKTIMYLLLSAFHVNTMVTACNGFFPVFLLRCQETWPIVQTYAIKSGSTVIFHQLQLHSSLICSRRCGIVKIH